MTSHWASGQFCLRRDQQGTGETYQTLCALTVVIVCVGLVLGAVHASTSQAANDAARHRAQLQADIALDALARDSALVGAPGVLDWGRAAEVAAGRASLSFAPTALRVVTLRSVLSGGELFLSGSASTIDPHLLFTSRPVSIMMASGAVEPGVLRIGVEVGL
jgi:hypothetical protein